MARWPTAEPGDRVAVIAPAGPFDVAAFERGVERLRTHYDVVVDPGVTQTHGFLAGSDARRLDELRGALADPDVRAVVAVRGGYGSARLLPSLSIQEVASAGKLLVGFSDITALHALWARAGVGSLHGPMVAALGRDGRDGETQLPRWRAAVAGETSTLTGLRPLQNGRARGVLRGGNLAVLCALLGTPYMPPLDGAVLFLEDVGERPYRIDRMLTSLLHSGALSSVAAVVLGHFTDCEPPDGSSHPAAEAVLRERLSELGVPVAAGLPAGHIDDNLPLPLGRTVELDADSGQLVFVD